MSEHFKKMENPLNLLAPAEEVWEALIVAAREARQNALRLGTLLSQISQQRDHWLPKLGCRSLQDIANKLGITDRKFRHLVSLSESWQDACQVLQKTLPLPKNNLVASNIYTLKQSVEFNVYQDLLQRFYLGDTPTLKIAEEIESIKANFVLQIKGSPKTRNKSRKAFLDVASMTIYDTKILDEICSGFLKLDETQKQNTLCSIAEVIGALEEDLLKTDNVSDGLSNSPVAFPAVPAGGSPLLLTSGSGTAFVGGVWSLQTNRSV